MKFGVRSYSLTEDAPPIIIGEIGVNHNGSAELARKLVDVAVDAGVHVVKFQVFKTEKEISRFAELAPYQKETAAPAASQFDLCKALEIDNDALRELQTYCAGKGIGFLCSVFDFESTDFLVDELKVESLKIASGEVTNIPFLEYIGSKRVDVILSTGASTLDEIRAAVDTLTRSGCPNLALLHCVSNYPAPSAELNLSAIRTLRKEFGRPVGFSDHSCGVEAATIAVALGSRVIEKHYTLDRNMEGPDHKASAEPLELGQLVRSVADVHRMLGDGRKRPMPCELQNLPLIRRSLVAAHDLQAGTELTRAMIEIKRPASGIKPVDLPLVIGRRLVADVGADQPLDWDCLAAES